MDTETSGSSSTLTQSNLWMPGTNPYGPQFPVPVPTQARPRSLNYAAGRGMYIMLAICGGIICLRIYLFDIGLLAGKAIPPSLDDAYSENASFRYKRYLLWSALPDFVVLTFGSAIVSRLNRFKQTTICILWSIFCVLSLEPLGFDVFNALESYGDPRFEAFMWFYLLVVLYRVVVIVICLIFLGHLVDIINENQRIREGGAEGGVPPQQKCSTKHNLID